jgi:hypothetical protein
MPGELKSSLSSATPIDLWQFEGKAGQMAIISMVTEDSSLDPALRLRDDDLNTLAYNEDYDGLNARIEYRLLKDGSYVIEARAQRGNGDYLLSLLLSRESAGFHQEAPELTPQECGQDRQDITSIEVGTPVVLARHRPVSGEMNWNSQMDWYVGRSAKITDVFAGVDSVGCPVVRVDIDDGQFYWRVRDLHLNPGLLDRIGLLAQGPSLYLIALISCCMGPILVFAALLLLKRFLRRKAS